MGSKNMMFVIGILVTAFAVAETHVPGGFIGGTWTLAGSPYIIEGNCVIPSESTLVIEPGVEVVFNPWCRLRCEGQLLAIGTENDSIYFVPSDTVIGSEGLHFLNTDSSPQDSSKLAFCEISHGVGSPYPDLYMHGGGLYIKNSSRLRISHCLIAHCRTQNVTGAAGYNGQSGAYQGEPGGPGETVAAGNGGAIYCENSSPIIEYSTICENTTGDAHGGNGGNGGGAFNLSTSAHGGNGGQGGNGAGGKGGAIFLLNSGASIYGNAIFHNYTGDGYGGTGGYGGQGCAPEYYGYGGNGGAGGDGFAGSGGAIFCESSFFASITNSLIYQNIPGTGTGGTGGHGGSAMGSMFGYPGGGGSGGDGYGGNGYAICTSSNSLDNIHNCTITEHNCLSTGQAGAGGINGGGTGTGVPGQEFLGTNIIYGTNTVVINTIVWNNVSTAINTGNSVSYSCVQGGFSGTGNISANPLFVNTALENFCLAQIVAGQPQQSPCVDAGDPYSAMIIGTTRTDGIQDSGVIDMGYHYPLNTVLPGIGLVLTPHNPPIQIPASGGNFQFDVEIFYNALFTSVIDFWTVISLPDSTPLPIFSRNNITLPGGGYVFRPNLTQYIPAGAPSGIYTYTAFIRDHYTWEELAQDSFTFEKLPGYDYPAHMRGWLLEGWDDEDSK